MELYKIFHIEAAHLLPKVPENHKCRRLHGHSFEIKVTVSGTVDDNLGWVMDFAEISRLSVPVMDQLDHYYLNEIPGLENPTSENLAIWIWQRLKPALPCLASIEIAETCNSGCKYTGQ